MFSLSSAKRTFWWTVLITTALKCWLAVYFPLTSDEAFFDLWAKFPNWGYYDHPPMIGWWLWGLHQLGDAPWVLRSATLVLTTLMAWGIVRLAKLLLPWQEEPRAWLAGAVYLAMPVSWYAVFVTTDTPLIFFMGLSIFAYVKALKHHSAWAMVWSGVWLGLAFLSKYFAVLLGVAYALHLLCVRRQFKMFWMIVLGSLPFVAVNVLYNAYNCWNNIMFNLVNRHDDAQLGWRTVLTYLGMMVYLITPWVLWRLIAGFSTWKKESALAFALCVPLAVFFLVSLEKTVGLHWVLGFIPVAFVLLALCASERLLKRYVVFNAVLSVPHLILFAVLMHGDAALWPSASFQQDVRFHREMPAIVQALKQDMPPHAVLATLAYSPAALMSYYAGEVVPVFGPGKYHARNDDVFVDWRVLDGKSIRIVNKAKPIDPSVYQGYFDSVRVSSITVHGIPFAIVDGERFNYAKFRDVVLREAVTKYYQIPKALPVLDCPFARKYGFEAACGVSD